MSRRRLAQVAAENVRAHRIKAGLSVAELAERADITPRTIWRIEAGTQTDPRMSTARALAAALGVEVADLLPVDEEVAA